MRIIVTGSRDWPEPAVVYEAIMDELPRMPWAVREPVTVVHGGCPTGADAAAAAWVRSADWGVDEEVFAADWAAHGRAAGPKRNQRMIDAGGDLVLAFPLPGGRGTQDCMRRAEAAGIPVKNLGEL